LEDNLHDGNVINKIPNTVYGITDLAGNVGGTAIVPLSASCTVGVASVTALKP